MKTLYLNNSGSKWTTRPSQQIRLISLKDNYNKIRKVEFYSSFGNFGAINLKYKGQRLSLLAQSKDKDGLTVCFVDYKEYYNDLKNIDSLINNF